MIDLLNVPDLEKKIDEIVGEAIEDKEKEIKEANKVLDNLKQQRTDGIYYSQIDTNRQNEKHTQNIRNYILTKLVFLRAS